MHFFRWGRGMHLSFPNSLENRLPLLQERWARYLVDGDFDLFVEFTVALNSLAEQFNRLRLPGLVRLCEGLENTALAYIGDSSVHPLAAQEIGALQRQLDTLVGSVASSRGPLAERRLEEGAEPCPEIDWIKPRSVWIVAADEQRGLAEGLCHQLRFFGFCILEIAWDAALPIEEAPLAVLFIPAKTSRETDELTDRKSTRLNSSHIQKSRMPSSA